MKTKKIIVYILMFLPLVVSLAAMPFLPEQIPAHYGFNNQVDRWGSKYEILIYPAVIIFMGFFMLGMSKYSAKQEKTGNNNENIMLTSSIVLLVLFDVMNGYSIYTSLNMVENLSSVPVDLSRLIFGILGAIMIILGNIVPKLRINSTMGLRTVWSMKNETTWKKSQRFGGISGIIGGAVIIVICFLLRGVHCFFASLAVIAVLLIIDVIYTYKISKIY